MRLHRVPERHRSTVVAYSAIVPLIVCATLANLEAPVSRATGVLTVLVMVALAAATGLRTAGVAATLSGAVWFDYFIAEPRGHFSIGNVEDAQTAVLLVALGLAVTEVAMRGRTPERRAGAEIGNAKLTEADRD